jgi:hypothetical protein
MKAILIIIIFSLSSCYITKQRGADGKKCKVEMKRVKMKPEKNLGY